MYGPSGGGDFNGGGGGRGGFGGRGDGGGRGRGGGDRQFTPRGSMSAGANQKPPLTDLNPQMKAMFMARPPVEFKKPIESRECPPYTGIGHLVNLFEKETPDKTPFELPAERKKRVREHMQMLHEEKNELLVADWDPHAVPHATENAYHTLFVARISFDTTEKKLRREFEQYGPVRTVKMITDKNDKARGYAFVEFEKEEDMTSAYKKADSRKVDGRRILVDVERGRTVRNWRPRRFGGGLGGRKGVKSRKEIEDAEAKKLLQDKADKVTAVYGGDRGGGASRPMDRDNRVRERDNGGDRNRDREDREREERDRDRDRDRGGPVSRPGLGSSRDKPRDNGSSMYGPGAGGGDRDRDRDSKGPERRGSSRDRDRDRDRGDRDRGKDRGSDRGGERRRSRSRDRR